MLPKEQGLTAEVVRQLLDYEPITGLLRWRANPARNAAWNTRRAGKIAGGPNWNGYIYIRLNDTLHQGHRLAWLLTHGRWPTNEVDHINGEPGDNRLANLREADRSQNLFNKRRQSNNTSGYIGVRFRPHHGKWEARINVRGETLWRRYFETAQEAAAARRIEIARLHGQYAKLEG